MYLKKNYVEQVPEFLEQIRKNKGNYTYDKKTGGNIDTRPRLWTKIPFSGFIDPLVTERKNLKKRLKEKETGIDLNLINDFSNYLLTLSMGSFPRDILNGQIRLSQIIINQKNWVFCLIKWF